MTGAASQWYSLRRGAGGEGGRTLTAEERSGGRMPERGASYAASGCGLRLRRPRHGGDGLRLKRTARDGPHHGGSVTGAWGSQRLSRRGAGERGELSREES